jgi:excisionase family DNA binding protein
MPPNKKPDEWVTPEELAAQVKVSVETVYWWNRTNKAPKRHKFGKHVRYTRADVDAWLRDRLVLDATGLDAGEQ